ncbi:MAG: hypothetical protein WCC13_05305 [Methylovirgula sp.]
MPNGLARLEVEIDTARYLVEAARMACGEVEPDNHRGALQVVLELAREKLDEVSQLVRPKEAEGKTEESQRDDPSESPESPLPDTAGQDR